MTPEISKALLLMLVGMITVFLILGLVILSGNLLIRLVNQLSPTIKEQVLKSQPLDARIPLPRKKVAAIVSAVQAATGSRGRIDKIERIIED